MVRKGFVLGVALVALLVLLWATGGVVAGPPLEGPEGDVTIAGVVASTISYQGTLTDDAGNPLDGTYTMQFQLYDAQSGGTLLWDSGAQSVQVVNGLFNVELAVDQSDFNGQELWLEVTVGAETLTPRQEVLPVPYALSLRPGARIDGSATGPHLYDAVLNVKNYDTSAGRTAIHGVSGSAVSGYPGQEVGVQGEAANGYGVAGYSSDNAGVYGYSGTSYGVWGVGDPGVRGYSTSGDGVDGVATASNKSGVYGHSTDGFGVTGRSTNNHAVQGFSTSHSHAAVYGNNTAGTGVRGEHTHATLTAPAVYGKNTGSGTGVLGDRNDSLVRGAVMGRNYGAGYGVQGTSTNSHGVYGDGKTYGFYTPDKIYAGNGYVDIAEHIDAASDVEPGDVVVIDPDRDERVVKCTKPYDTSVAGIISTDPAFLIGNSDTKTPLALAGRVPCKVSAENGPIHRGDLLTTSSTPGYAMKATEPKLGTILGKALGELKSGTGVIYVLVILQ